MDNKLRQETIQELLRKVEQLSSRDFDWFLNCYDILKITQEKFEKEGYDILEINNKKIPILFSSMLTGQRALDTHSLRRLKWHIKTIFE